MMMHWAIPKRNPVIIRKKLLLFRHFHFCVNPSINSGNTNNGTSHHERINEYLNNNGKKRYPISIAIHLAQSGNTNEPTLIDRSKFR